jgi:integrase
MPRKKLTAIAIAALRPRAERYEVSDNASALRVLVLPSGRKSFVLRYRRPDGRSAKLTLGAFDPSAEMVDEPILGAPMTLGAARQLAAEMLREKARGRDPAQLRIKSRVVLSLSFGEVARAYAAHLVEVNRVGRQTARIVDAIASAWSHRRLDEITASDCIDMVQRCRRNGFPGQVVRRSGPSDSRARLAHSTLSGLFGWAVKKCKLERSPVTGLAPPPASVARERVLSDVEIPVFWNAAEALSPWHRGCLRLLLVTGARLREISELRDDEIRDGAIMLSRARTKNKRAHTIPLSSFAREVLDAVPRVEGCGYVFSAGRVPINGWHRVKARLDARMLELGWNGEPFVIHDLRRTAATLLARNGTPIHVTEKILNHVSGKLGGLVGVYQRYEYRIEMAEALERLGERVRGLVARAPRSSAEGRPAGPSSPYPPITEPALAAD